MRPLPILILPLLACASAPSIAQPEPDSWPTFETAPPPDFGEGPPARDVRPAGETGWYAETYGVSLAEADRRARLQHEIANEIGRIRERLEREQAGNHADMWLEHAPEYRLVVAFVRDPEATLRRYTTHPLFTARQVEHPLVELERARDEAFVQFRRLGVPAGGGVDVRANRVAVEVALAQDEVDALVRDGRVRVSPSVRLEGHRPLEGEGAVSAEARRFVRLFPQARHRTDAETQELNLGTIVLRDGCLRLDRPGADDPVAFFGAESAIRIDPTGHPVLYQREPGAAAGVRAGARMVLGGGAGRPIEDPELLAPIRAAGCAGPVA